MKRPKIAVIGSSMTDLVAYVDRVPDRGETVSGQSFAMGGGGKGANQAVAAAKLGAEVLFVGRVGDDAFADATHAALSGHGVDIRHLGRVPGVASGVATILVEASGENRIVIAKGANDHLTPADIDRAAGDLDGCRLILLQLEVPLDTVYHAIALGAARGIPVLLNPAPARTDLDLGRLAGLSFLVPNETELATLSGCPVGSVAEAEAAARVLIARGVRCVIVTLGARGALLVTADNTLAVDPLTVTPIDTTGAGDAFIGAFAWSYAATADLAASLRVAVRYAAHSITGRGTQGAYATAEGFAAFLAERGDTFTAPGAS